MRIMALDVGDSRIGVALSDPLEMLASPLTIINRLNEASDFPPILELAKQLDSQKHDKQIIVGYRDELFLEKELEKYGHIYIATEDGSVGARGNVMDAIRENRLTADMIYACGPTPMLRAIKQYAAEHKIPAWISMEEKMACGVGACLGCVCKTTDKDEHAQVNSRRVCKDGPVFLAEEVIL